MSGEYKISSRFGYLNKLTNCNFTKVYNFTVTISEINLAGFFDGKSFQLINKNSKEIFVNIPITIRLII
jgi:hypothetical protein